MNLVLILRSSLGAQQPFAAHLLSLGEGLALGITVGNGGFDKVEEADAKQTGDFSVLCSSLFWFGFFGGVFFLTRGEWGMECSSHTLDQILCKNCIPPGFKN